MRSRTKQRIFAFGLAAIVMGILTFSQRQPGETPMVPPFPAPPYPPSDIQAGRARNRALLGTEYIDVLQWQPNPRNVGTEISNFRIYRIENGHQSVLAEVNSTLREHWVRGLKEDITRYYGVTAVARDGSESVPVVVSIQAREHH